MICETFCEVLSKHLHILVVESVFSAFSSGARSRRVLTQLRRVMSVFWERSSDALVLSLQTETTRICLASPTLLTFMNMDNADNKKVLVFELPYSKQTVQTAYIVNMDEMSSRSEWQKDSVSMLPEENWPFIKSLGGLIDRAHDENVFPNHRLHEFERGDENLHCEATVTSMEAGSVLVVLRDISDRIQRFEAEKKLAVEATEREKDSQTNRFSKFSLTQREAASNLSGSSMLLTNLCLQFPNYLYSETRSKFATQAPFSTFPYNAMLSNLRAHIH